MQRLFEYNRYEFRGLVIYAVNLVYQQQTYKNINYHSPSTRIDFWFNTMSVFFFLDAPRRRPMEEDPFPLDIRMMIQYYPNQYI